MVGDSCPCRYTEAVVSTIGQTLSDDTRDPDLEESDRPEPHLLLLLEGERPLAGTSVHSLAGVSSVCLGRGRERRAQRPGRKHPADLELTVPDQRMSGTHAILTRVRGRWVLEDCSSKNGTRVNGELVSQFALRDGDIIELGRTTFLYEHARLASATRDMSTKENAGTHTLHPGFAAALNQLRTLSKKTEIPVLIHGESGTGKERVATQLHAWTAREGRFVAVNCGALPATLVESELFGSQKGSFSGASQDRKGLIRSADKGTLFLDEIADMPLTSQTALLRVLQERTVTPVGGTHSLPVNIQVVSATHQDLSLAIERQEFRGDLFSRLAGYRITIPPLRERKSDLGILIRSILTDLPEGQRIRFGAGSMRLLLNHDWPLNVRELYHVLQSSAALSPDGNITPELLPETVTSPEPTVRIQQSTQAATAPFNGMPLSEEQQSHRAELVELMRTTNGNVSEAARRLGKARSQLQRWLRRYDLTPTDYKP